MASVDHTIVLGDGRVGVLLLHGLGGTPTEMKLLAKKLAAQGCAVVCPQLAGHCGDESDLVATGWRDWLASARDAFEDLRGRCDSVIVGGLSLGGVLAAKLAAEEEARIDGLFMLGPTLWYDGWSIPRYGFLLKLLIDTPLGRRYRFEEREPYGIKDERIRSIVLKNLNSGDSSKSGLSATPALALKQMWALVAALKVDLPRIRQRTLIVHARDDDIAGLSNAIYLQQRLGGIVETMVLDDSYHLVTVDRQRGIAGDRVASFVREIAERSLAFRAKDAPGALQGSQA